MNKWVIIIVVLTSFIIAVVNNIVNEERVDWIGSPHVLEKPEEY